jgi:hypothetical protein
MLMSGMIRYSWSGCSQGKRKALTPMYCRKLINNIKLSWPCKNIHSTNNTGNYLRDKVKAKEGHLQGQ